MEFTNFYTELIFYLFKATASWDISYGGNSIFINIKYFYNSQKTKEACYVRDITLNLNIKLKEYYSAKYYPLAV